MSWREQLKEATRSAHQDLDSSFNRLDLTDPLDYRLFLDAHATVLPSCEATLAASGAHTLLPDWNDRIRAPALADDLATVGARRVFTTTSATPIEPAAAFGMMYVLEGSRLGGAVLAQRVQHNTDPLCRAATRYLRHGTGLRLWPLFIISLENADCIREKIDVAVAGALFTFGLFANAARLAKTVLPGA